MCCNCVENLGSKDKGPQPDTVPNLQRSIVVHRCAKMDPEPLAPLAQAVLHHWHCRRCRCGHLAHCDRRGRRDRHGRRGRRGQEMGQAWGLA